MYRNVVDFGAIINVSRYLYPDRKQSFDRTLVALMKYAPDGTILALNRGVYSSQNLENDYIYELENHRLQKVSGKSMNLIGGRITDGTLGYQGKVNFSYDEVGRMTSDASKGMYLQWRNDDDLPSSVTVVGATGWNKDPVLMNFAYKGGARIAKFRNAIISANSIKTNEARYYLLGEKEIRIGEDGKIRAMMYPSYAGSGRSTYDYTTENITTEFSTTDYLGSTVRVNKVETNTLSPTLSVENDSWGREIQSVESGSEEFDDRFTGKKKEVELGLDYFGARYLDKDFAMWVSPDEMRQHYNLYLYGSDNPICRIDNDGNVDMPPVHIVGQAPAVSKYGMSSDQLVIAMKNSPAVKPAQRDAIVKNTIKIGLSVLGRGKPIVAGIEAYDLSNDVSEDLQSKNPTERLTVTVARELVSQAGGKYFDGVKQAGGMVGRGLSEAYSFVIGIFADRAKVNIDKKSEANQ